MVQQGRLWLQSVRQQNEALIESFCYDATGNRTSHTVGRTTTSYGYPATSQRLQQVGKVRPGGSRAG